MQTAFVDSAPKILPIQEFKDWSVPGVRESNASSPDVAERRNLVLDESRYGQAFRKGYPTTVRFLISLGAKIETAEEIAQAAWARGWEYLWQLQRPEMIGPWINSIAKNLLRNHIRADRRLEGLEDTTLLASPAPLRWDAERMLLQCEERDLKIMRDFYLEGYTAEEIATEIGSTPVAVRVRLFRIRRALRSHFVQCPASQNAQLARSA